MRFEVGGEHDIDLENPGPHRWVKYGAALGGYLDLTGHNRVLGLSLAAQFADPLGDEDVPFNELSSLGGNEYMRGFRPGRLLGRSAVSATLEYRYPIWSFLDGSVQAAVGNVFDEHLSDFDLELLRFSWAVGIRSAGAERDHAFNVLIGSGTETFADGAELTSLRFMFGATQGF